MVYLLEYAWNDQTKHTVTLLPHSTWLLGSLTSNQILLKGDHVEPIHALLEYIEQHWVLTDLGSKTGVYVNDQKIHIEHTLAPQDRIKIGSCTLNFQEVAEAATHTVHAKTSQSSKKRTSQAHEKPLFQQESLSSGPVLEVVAYWGNTVLNVEHFDPSHSIIQNISIGNYGTAHFLSANPEDVKPKILAKTKASGFELEVTDSMHGRIRDNGVIKNIGPGHYTLGLKDVAHIQYGDIQYFFIFVRPLMVELPPKQFRDPFMLSMGSIALLMYLTFAAALVLTEPKPLKSQDDEIWAVVQVPDLPKSVEKPENILAEVTKPADPPPPPLVVKEEPQPAQPEVAQEKPPKPTPPPVETTQKAVKVLTAAKTQLPASVPAPALKKPVQTKAGNDTQGAQRKGETKESTPGVESEKSAKPSGLSLGKLGIGVGNIKSLDAAGAIKTNFKNSVGGAGGGSGSGMKTLGLGGLGDTHSVGLTGASGNASQFSTNSDTVGTGSVSKNFAHKQGATQVNVRAGDPLISGGLTQEEILEVIKSHINHIRHCYERLLQNTPDAKGKIKVKFMINTSGQVTSADIVEKTIQSETMEQCVTTAIRRWKFPEPRGNSPVSVSYPFIFNPL